ncbi:MAG: hypothetical protein CMB80_27680 [Flammeovirgaceae bacterium]|nr:hypothetical protein [Flammeovirgaceae bacterium]HCX24677.1 hypothetical protein [Cytophagales bacterium]|tara:strand:- start:83 stop:841 length:759 start_codon:yes stop_codon:yes gene_type:complete
MKRIIWISILAIACQPTTEKAPYTNPTHHIAEITKVMNAHGGFEKWESMKTLEYELENGETQLISLKDRKVLLENEQRTIGFDGTNVWVTPDTVDASGARFYHNLYFYFFAMPFVLGDPGITYEKVDPKEFKGETLSGVKISYGASTGDSPDDNYILWYDPSSYNMKWLMYTSTYRSGEPSDRFNLIKYNDWIDVNELKLPTRLQWHVYKNDTIGEVRGEALFANITLSVDEPVDSLFAMPSDAQIAPGPQQ